VQRLRARQKEEKPNLVPQKAKYGDFAVDAQIAVITPLHCLEHWPVHVSKGRVALQVDEHDSKERCNIQMKPA
jgi:hypothetical protein